MSDQTSWRGDHTGFRRRFDLFDDDNDGVIPSSRLGDLMEFVGCDLTGRQLEDCIKTVDPQEKGVVTFGAFVSLMERRLAEVGESGQEEIYDTFCLLDDDGDGYISLGDLRVGMNALRYVFDEEDLVAMIQEADLDKDGRVSFPEFLKATKDQ